MFFFRNFYKLKLFISFQIIVSRKIKSFDQFRWFIQIFKRFSHKLYKFLNFERLKNILELRILEIFVKYGHWKNK